MTPKETMIEYNRMGLSTIPCVSHSTFGIDALKRPHVASWQAYQREMPDIATIEAWYQASPDAAIGITCGAASGNLVVVDFENKDGCDAYRKWRKRIRDMVDSGQLPLGDFAAIQSIPAVITPTGGVHMYCRLSEPHSGGKIASRANGSVMIETRGHGHYVIAPGSPITCHTAGQRAPTEAYAALATRPGPPHYHWVAGLPASVPTVPDDLYAIIIQACVECSEYAVDVVPESERPVTRQSAEGHADGLDYEMMPGTDFNLHGSWEETGLFAAGWTWASRKEDGESGYLTRPGKQSGISATLGIIRSQEHGYPYFYAFSTSVSAPLVAEKPMSRYAVFAALQHNGDFVAAARALLDMGYGRKTPKKAVSEEAVNEMIENASTKQHAIADAINVPDVVDERTMCIEERDAARGYKLFDELRPADPLPDYWDGLIKPRALTLLSAHPGVGKTTLITHLLRDLATKEQFCGRPIRAAKVLMISEEDESEWHDRRQEHQLPGNYVLYHESFDARFEQYLPMSWAEKCKKIERIVKREGIDIIVIDTLNEAWLVENENDARQCLDAIKRLKQIVKKPESNVAILLVTHLRKSAGNGDVGGTRGSSAVPGAVDICISMRRAGDDEVRYVDAEKRRNIRVIERTKSRWSNPKKPGSTPEKMWILFDQLECEIDSAYSDASGLIDASVVEDCEEIIKANEIDLPATVRNILRESAGYLMLTVVAIRVRDVHKGKHGTGAAKVRLVLEEMVESGECEKIGGKTNPAYCLSEFATKKGV